MVYQPGAALAPLERLAGSASPAKRNAPQSVETRHGDLNSF
ncbi:MAG: hypothetical protein QNJ02_12390 [Desulfobacterales bacterium]|nr:hypothetical protein [Desulfobacterales bacterium]